MEQALGDNLSLSNSREVVMKIFGAIVAGVVVAVLYYSWGLVWKSVLVLAVLGTVMSQVGHAKDWREIFTTAGTICLFAVVVASLILLLQLFIMS